MTDEMTFSYAVVILVYIIYLMNYDVKNIITCKFEKGHYISQNGRLINPKMLFHKQ